MRMDWKQTVVWAMRTLSFVNWDRYVNNGHTVSLYGWIDRDDQYKDFVLLEYITATAELGFVTSSAKHSEHIAVVLFGDLVGHRDCKRIEEGFQEFEINNVIHI